MNMCTIWWSSCYVDDMHGHKNPVSKQAKIVECIFSQFHSKEAWAATKRKHSNIFYTCTSYLDICTKYLRKRVSEKRRKKLSAKGSKRSVCALSLLCFLLYFGTTFTSFVRCSIPATYFDVFFYPFLAFSLNMAWLCGSSQLLVSTLLLSLYDFSRNFFFVCSFKSKRG